MKKKREEDVKAQILVKKMKELSQIREIQTSTVVWSGIHFYSFKSIFVLFISSYCKFTGNVEKVFAATIQHNRTSILVSA